MLQRLFNLFRRDRCLFHYWDGTRNRSADPVASWRKLATHEVDLISESATARNPMKDDGTPFYPAKEVYVAEDRLRMMTRDIFGVAEWKEDQPGLTVDETDELLNLFMEFCADLKKKRSLSPMPSVPSTSPEPAPCSDTAACPAGVAPDSCCSPSASTAAVPTGP